MEYDSHIECTAPRIAEGVAPVKEGCREYGGGNGREMGGGGADVGVDRGGDGQPGAIPDEMCVWKGEGECGGGGCMLDIIILYKNNIHYLLYLFT